MGYGIHAGGRKPPRVPLLPPATIYSVALGIPPFGLALQPGQAERLDEPFRLPLLLPVRPAGWRKGRLPLRSLSALPPGRTRRLRGCYVATIAIAWGAVVKSLIDPRN